MCLTSLHLRHLSWTNLNDYSTHIVLALATVAARLQHAADVLGKSIHTSIARRH